MSEAIDSKINDEIKNAMRARDQLRLDTLRAMKSAIKYKLVDKRNESLTEPEYFAVFQTLIKQRTEAFEQYEKVGSAEAAAKEKAEMEVIKEFMPQALSADELSSLVDQAVSDLGANSMKDMGKVMKALQDKVAGRADGKSLSEAVKKRLSA